MFLFFRRRKRYFYCLLLILGALICFSSILPIRIAITHLLAPEPQAIFMLGGGWGRERVTALFAQSHPELEVWLSGGVQRERIEAIFTEAGVTMERVHLDYRALDTVTNFTTMVDVFKEAKINHVYLLTSEFHMARSRTIATIVFGFHGIIITPIPIPDQQKSEPWLKIPRDAFRAIVWVITGHSGSSLHSFYRHLREYLSHIV